MGGQDDALCERVLPCKFLQLQAERKTGTDPRQPADVIAIDLCRQRFAVKARRDGDHGIRVHVINVRIAHQRMQGRIDAGRPGIQVERAVRVVAGHAVFIRGTAVAGGQCE